jgi:hypothetical protein
MELECLNVSSYLGIDIGYVTSLAVPSDVYFSHEILLWQNPCIRYTRER